MYLVTLTLKRLAGDDNVKVSVPHGAESGFDPYQAVRDLDDDTVFGYLHGKMLPIDSPGEWVSEAVCVLCHVGSARL